MVNKHINFTVNLAYFEPIQKPGMSFEYYLLSNHSKFPLSDSCPPKYRNKKFNSNNFANITTDANKTDYFTDFLYLSILTCLILLSSVAGVILL